MNECLLRHQNNAKRFILCKKYIKITKYKKKSGENNKINFYELITIN